MPSSLPRSYKHAVTTVDIEHLKKRMVLVNPDPHFLFDRAVKECKRRPPPARTRKKLEEIKKDSLRCIERAHRFLDAYLGRVVETCPFIEDLHPLFRELLLLSVNVNDYKVCLSRLNSSRKILLKIFREEARRVKSSESSKEVLLARRSFFGRTLSVLETLDKCLKEIKLAQQAFLTLPELDVKLPTVVIAGAPNVGKSTLLRALTRAKPKVSPYPFTTRELIVGVLERKGLKIQLVDTPGLLDTPLEEKNKVERQAVLAIRHIASLIFFVVDPTESCGFPLEFQKTVYDQLSLNFPGIKIVKIANKIDIATKEHIEKLERVFASADFIHVSAENKQNIEKIFETLDSHFSLPDQG
ncbi:NOG1 family protein [Infirmifilum sp. SLHALR2]|nr:MAG: hypothetical protein B7L53_08470 [Thermofilum sp. NZ13]